MLSLGLVSPDPFFRRVASESFQQTADWQMAFFPCLEQALGAWIRQPPSLVLWHEEKRKPSKEDTAKWNELCAGLEAGDGKERPLLLFAGLASEDFWDGFSVTEFFALPIRLGYLLSRLSFYGKALAQPSSATFKLGPFLFSPRKRTLEDTEEKQIVKLTDKEAALLDYLRLAAAPVSREELLEALWGYGAQIDTHTLETHIYRLRRKMLVGGKRPDAFLSETGGYRLRPDWL